jgi:hypothetical protein
MALCLLGTMGFSAPLAAPVAAQRAAVSMAMAKSQALPFLEKPAKLDGSLPGDVGFDPLGLSNYFPLAYMREAELKHGRVCMLAIVGYIAVDAGLRVRGIRHWCSDPLVCAQGHALMGPRCPALRLTLTMPYRFYPLRRLVP